MTLPKAKYPLTDIFVYSLDKKIPFRQFLVKEERLFESPDSDRHVLIKSISDCITSCSLGKVDGTTLPIFDLQNIWIQLSKISEIEIPDWAFMCGDCGEYNTQSINYDDFGFKLTDYHTDILPLRDDLIVKMRYPTAGELFEFDKEKIPYYDIAATCIDSIKIKGEKVENISEEEKIEFIETLTSSEFEMITLFFASMPVVQNVIEFECGKCGTENQAVMNGFFGESE
tara:strand:- start:5517 stop:6200 length:684 start_codon:yes stop_codon:yes gene_type:complete